MHGWTVLCLTLALLSLGMCKQARSSRETVCDASSRRGPNPVSTVPYAELIGKLLDESVYPKHTRPSINLKEPTIVEFGLELNAIVDLEEPKQMLKTQLSLILSWDDEYLTWDENSCEVPEVRIPSTKMWIPDITLLNSADSSNFMLESRLVRVKPNGTTEWRSYIVLASFCKINFLFFPYDEQNCELRFRAWTYPQEQVTFKLSPEFNADDAVDHGEWHIEGMGGKIILAHEDHGTFSDVVVTISISRRPQFYLMNIVVPCLIIYLLTLFSFCLPCDSGEKIGFGITILLSLTVFMLISADMMPPTSDNFPLLSQFYTATMVLVAASVGMSVMVLNFNHRPPGARRAPAWIRRLLLHSRCRRSINFHGVRKFVLRSFAEPGTTEVMSCTKGAEPGTTELTYAESPSAKTTKSSCLSEDYSASDHILGDSSQLHDDNNGAIGMVRYLSSPKLGRPASSKRDCAKEEQETSLTLDGELRVGAPLPQDGGAHESAALSRLLGNISGDLRKLVVHKEEEKEEEAIYDEWKLLAKAVDRIFLALFIIASCILVIVLGSEMLRRTKVH